MVGMSTFRDFVQAALADPDLLREYDRLRGTALSDSGGIGHMIDVATGRFSSDAEGFLGFLWDLWLRVPSR